MSLLSSDSLIPQAPRFDDIVGLLLTTAARWLFGSGAVGSVVIAVILTALAVKSWRDLIHEGRRSAVRLARLAGTGGGRAAQIAMLVRERLAALPAVAVVLNAASTVVVLATQAIWLFTSWGLSTWLSELWNAYIWGSWEIPVGAPWRSFTGYYTVWCTLMLLVGWIAAMTAGRDRQARHDRLAAAGSAAGVVPALMVLPLFLLLVLGTALGVLYSVVAVVLGGSSVSEYWADLGGLWLYVLGVVGYLVGTALAVMASELVCRAWIARPRQY